MAGYSERLRLPAARPGARGPARFRASATVELDARGAILSMDVIGVPRSVEDGLTSALPPRLSTTGTDGDEDGLPRVITDEGWLWVRFREGAVATTASGLGLIILERLGDDRGRLVVCLDPEGPHVPRGPAVPPRPGPVTR